MKFEKLRFYYIEAPMLCGRFTAADKGGDQTGWSVWIMAVPVDVPFDDVRCLRYGDHAMSLSSLSLFIGFFCFRFNTHYAKSNAHFF
jgi:hypothetical protein